MQKQIQCVNLSACIASLFRVHAGIEWHETSKILQLANYEMASGERQIYYNKVQTHHLAYTIVMSWKFWCKLE